jgi:hypothetical protein
VGEGAPLVDDLERLAAAAAAFGEVTGVLAAEPASGRRLYLVAFAGDGSGEGEWLVLDNGGTPVDLREVVRETASIVGMCELAADAAGGGDLEELRVQLSRLRLLEDPPGIAGAEEAALALERAVGAPPRVARPAYLDAVGAATLALEQSLGESGSPFAASLRSGTAAVEELVRDVERRYKLPLR